MMELPILYVVSIATFAFGAMTFAVLAITYFRDWKPGDRHHQVFSVFTATCALAFIINLALQLVPALYGSAIGSALVITLAAITGLVPPLLFHLVVIEERTGGFFVTAFYVVSVAAALAHELSDADLLSNVPAITLATASAAGLAVQLLSRRQVAGTEGNYRNWLRVLLILTSIFAVTNVIYWHPAFSLVPDYLVLGFFCVTLYYKERLVFFDLLIKRGAFFALGFVMLAISLQTAWLIVPLWMLAPWLHRRLSGAIDHALLRRRYSIEEAEQIFFRDIQLATTEDDLRAYAARSLKDIFQTRAEVSFDDGAVNLHLEKDGPLMSDDRRLLQAFTQTLGMIRENIRYRQDQQQLRLLASRAELRALRAQINPHFLFNALNAIAGLIPSQPQLADQTVEELAQVFRYTLRRSEDEWVRMEEELEFIASYLRVEQARFGDRLRVTIDADPASARLMVPAMSVQPLVENAIKHGVSSVEGQGTVSIKTSLNQDVLRVDVCDNGNGFPNGFTLNGSGHGLRNVSERLKGYFGDHAQVTWDRATDGTHVVLTMPGRHTNGSRSDR